jgi:hypothetical protein
MRSSFAPSRAVSWTILASRWAIPPSRPYGHVASVDFLGCQCQLVVRRVRRRLRFLNRGIRLRTIDCRAVRAWPRVRGPLLDGSAADFAEEGGHAFRDTANRGGPLQAHSPSYRCMMSFYTSPSLSSLRPLSLMVFWRTSGTLGFLLLASSRVARETD